MSSSRESGAESPREEYVDPFFAGVGEICDTAMRGAGADGAALAILTGSATSRELMYASDTIAQQLDELEYTLGEGPCIDAYLDDRPQYHPDLTSVTRTSQWPTFAADATDLGVHALFAFPIPDGKRPMGVLELYRHTAGDLAEPEHASVVANAVAIARRLQTSWDELVTRFGGAEEAIDAMTTTGPALDETANPFNRRQIHVAGGMVGMQLGINPDEGIDRIRAYSYSRGRRISTVAADIIARRLTISYLGDALGG
jgi:hypothetical protein